MAKADGGTRVDSNDGAPQKLENLTLWQRVHDHLREEILSNRLGPGTELQEVALSQELGVSRGPIREALGRLAAEGLVTVRPRRGAVVRTLSPEEFLEAYQVREALEVLAVGLAVRRLTPAELDRLEALTDEMEAHAEAGDVHRFFLANTSFHQGIVEASGNRPLGALYRQLVGQMRHLQMHSLELRGNVQRSVVEHRKILRAMRAGEADRARELMSDHIRVPQRRLERLSAKRPVGEATPGNAAR